MITLGNEGGAANGGAAGSQGPPGSDRTHAEGARRPPPPGPPGASHLPADEAALAAAAVLLGAPAVAGWSAAEQDLAAHALAGQGMRGPGGAGSLETLRAEIRAGRDPLGEAFCRLRPPGRRRVSGQTFTPPPVISAMIGWAARQVEPARVVDPGTGSARFLVAAGRRWPTAELVGVETDPLAAMTGRAALAAAGMAGRATILLTDYRSVRLPRADGPALFLGNPPYVRHHQLGREWKQWLRAGAARRGLRASVLAGLHVHFFLATAAHAAPGDVGVLVTAAEWLDVNYGGLVRDLLLGPLGGQAVHVLDPSVPVFTDAASSAAITCFRPGTRPHAVRLRRVATVAALAGLPGGTPVPTAALRAAARWGPLLDRPARARRRLPAGHVELGELCRVHRGQVTGANKIWITEAGRATVPGRFLVPAVTRASELFGAGAELAATAGLRCVIDLPADLAELSAAESAQVGAFLRLARAAGAADSYTAAHRTPWWRVGMGAPAPILATYMARRPPAFVRNLAGARHVNIAHGLYPREPLPAAALDALAAHLRRTVTPGQGRTYAGGLTKFEPGEMERLPVPGPGLLAGAGPVRSSAGTTSGTATRSTE